MNTTSVFLPTDLYGVVGWPLGQSLSPLLHNTAFQTLGIPAAYYSFAIDPTHLADFITSVRCLPIKGCSVTIPHKTAVFAALDRVTPLAQRVGAVNTLFWDEGKLVGDNTDCTGFFAPLSTLSPDAVLLLGAGGAARAVLAALCSNQWDNIVITSPSNTRQYALADEFAVQAIPWEARYTQRSSLLINATPLGMHGDLVNQTPFDFNKAAALPSLVYDIVYNPAQTRLLAEAAALGIPSIAGLTMFLEQGLAQLYRWTGKKIADDLRSHLTQTLNNALAIHPA
ncbi:MAG: shikimate dehydrogenase [Desulfovibrio sp.]|nr:shikimate dehydrogenase [Desulfovibrio sp.]